MFGMSPMSHPHAAIRAGRGLLGPGESQCWGDWSGLCRQAPDKSCFTLKQVW